MYRKSAKLLIMSCLLIVVAVFSGCKEAIEQPSLFDRGDPINLEGLIKTMQERPTEDMTPGVTKVLLTDSEGNEIDKPELLDRIIEDFAPFFIPGSEMPTTLGFNHTHEGAFDILSPDPETHYSPYEHTSIWRYSGEVISFLRWYCPPDGECDYYWFTYKVYYCIGANYQCVKLGYDLACDPIPD